MTHWGEQYSHNESPATTAVEVCFDDDPGYNHDTFGETQNDTQNEIEPLSTTQSYGEGPDGSFYVYNTQTGELDLSQPLQPTAEQEEAFQTALAAGEAEVALLAPGGTETQEVWSIQTLTYSITPDNRRVITIAATTEIHEKREEPEELADASDIDRVGDPDTIIITVPDTSDFSPAPQTPAIEAPAVLHEVTADSDTDTIDDTTVLIVFSESEPAVATPQPPQEIPEVSIDIAPIEPQSTPEVALPVVGLNYPDMPAAPVLDTTEGTEPSASVLTAEPLTEAEPLQEEGATTVEPTALEAAPQEPTPKESSNIEQEPQEVQSELSPPPEYIVPSTLQPKQVVYLNELPPVVTTTVALPPIAIIKKPAVLPATQKIIPLPQKEHQVERLAATPEQRREEPVRLNLEQTTAPKPKIAVHITSHEDAPALTIEAPATTTQNHSKERPVAAVVPAERLVSPQHHRETVVAPSTWERANNSQNLMPWLTGFAADNDTLTDDDVIITFKPNSVTNRHRRTMHIGSLAA